MTDQFRQQIELGPGQGDGQAVPRDRPPGQVQRERAKRYQAGVFRTVAGATHGGPDPCHQLGDLERLLDVVVRAGLEADDDVDRVGPGRQHHDGQGGDRTDRPTDLEAVQAGQHDIEQDQIERLVTEAVQAGLTVVRGLDREPGLAQADGSDFADGRVVFDQQDPGVHSTPRACGHRRLAVGRSMPASRRGPGSTGPPTHDQRRIAP